MHFVKRVFANEDDQGSESSSVNVAAVLALLATPGGFASIFLLDKYSTLLQWVRGQRNFNPYRASVPDEYFFVVLSMTITGLVMVLRWNRLLPDRRDFANLAVLPIPIRNIFLANFTGLLGLALVFGIDVNAVSSFLFPAVVTLSDGTVAAFARVATAHVAAVFSASLFSFFAVFALVGLLMLLPSRLFRPVSVCARVLLVIVLLSEFLSNLFLQLFSGRLPQLQQVYTRWLPSYWFLSIYEQVAGLANARTSLLAGRALTALIAAMVIAVGAYALCYRRHFLRLAESLELLGGARRWFRIAWPEAITKRLFGAGFEHACHGFMWKVLLRSERHIMFAGGYMGLGFVLAAQTAADAAMQPRRGGLPSADWLSLPLLLAVFIVTGLRFAFDMPASLPANWVFRIAACGARRPDRIARAFLRMAILPWEVLLVGAITVRQFGWTIAAGHVATLVILTLLLIDALLLDFQKIPFTCSMQIETRQLVIRILCCVLGVLIAVPLTAHIERWMMELPARFAVLGLLSAGAWYAMRRHKRETSAYHAVTFEQQSSAAFELLKLA
jgi:hypothetical protein